MKKNFILIFRPKYYKLVNLRWRWSIKSTFFCNGILTHWAQYKQICDMSDHWLHQAADFTRFWFAEANSSVFRLCIDGIWHIGAVSRSTIQPIVQKCYSTLLFYRLPWTWTWICGIKVVYSVREISSVNLFISTLLDNDYSSWKPDKYSHTKKWQDRR